jgi:phosphoribosyl-dephospho-CoA transferase
MLPLSNQDWLDRTVEGLVRFSINLPGPMKLSTTCRMPGSLSGNATGAISFLSKERARMSMPKIMLRDAQDKLSLAESSA